MRIGLLTASLSRRGGNVFAALSLLGRSLHRPPEFDVAAFGLRDEMTASDLQAWGTMTVTAAPPLGPRKFGFSRELDLALADADLDLLHVHGLWTYAAVASRRWADATARPYIVTPHGMLDPWALRQRWWKKLCAGLLFEFAHLRGAACLHARCEVEARRLRALKLRNPICVIPNAVEPLPSQPPRPKPRTVDQGGTKHILLCFGPLLDGNARVLLRAWQVAHETCKRSASDWCLLVVAPEEDRGALARECAAFGIEKTVHFSSASASRELWESAAAVVLLPAASEQRAYAARAWSHGLPVLLCDARPPSNGLWAAPALAVQPTVESVVQGLLTLFEMSEADRAELGTRARGLVETRVAPAAIAEDMARVYRWVLGCGPRPSCVVMH